MGRLEQSRCEALRGESVLNKQHCGNAGNVWGNRDNRSAKRHGEFSTLNNHGLLENSIVWKQFPLFAGGIPNSSYYTHFSSVALSVNQSQDFPFLSTHSVAPYSGEHRLLTTHFTGSTAQNSSNPSNSDGKAKAKARQGSGFFQFFQF